MEGAMGGEPVYDDSDWTAEERHALAWEAGRHAGWNGDDMAVYDNGPWMDEERDLLRAEAIEALGWNGMEAYQDDE